MKKRLLFLLIIFLITVVGYAYFAPKPIQSVAWQAPKAPPLEGQYAKNNTLHQTIRMELPTINGEDLHGAEHIAIDKNGMAYMGTENGAIVRWNTNYPSQPMEIWTHIPNGRPLGLEFGPQGHLVIADAHLGLYQLLPDKTRQTLATGYQGKPFGFADDLAIAKNGDIYFSDATDVPWFTTHPHLADNIGGLEVIEHAGNGHLYVYRKATKTVEKLLSGLQFANGVALSANEDFVLVNETGHYHVLRYWLTGAQSGTHDVFIDNLPGMPDNITETCNGAFWLSLLLPRNALLDRLSNHPKLRDVLGIIPRWMQPRGRPVSHLIKLSSTGDVLQSLQDDKPHIVNTTTALEHKGKLYQGSLTDTAIGVYLLPNAKQPPTLCAQ